MVYLLYLLCLRAGRPGGLVRGASAEAQRSLQHGRASVGGSGSGRHAIQAVRGAGGRLGGRRRA
eukprot:4682528-Alexandrium_andersonii.AAC.1